MSFLYRYKASYKDSLPWIDGLKAAGHKILFVFDGKPPAQKEKEVKERRDVRESAATQAIAIRAHLAQESLDPKERELLEYSLARLEHQAWHLTREIRHEIQDALRSRSIPFVKAIEEADGVLVDLAAHNKLDVVLSTDMDYLLSAVPRLWIPLGTEEVEEIRLADVLEGEGLTEAQLLDAGILCGVEPLRGCQTFLPKTAFSWIRYYGSLEIVIQKKALTFLSADGRIEEVRRHFRARESWPEGIRDDTRAENWDFLSTL